MKKPMNMRRRLVPTSIQNPAVPINSHNLARMVDGAGKNRTSMKPSRALASQSRSKTRGETIHIGIQRPNDLPIVRCDEGEDKGLLGILLTLKGYPADSEFIATFAVAVTRPDSWGGARSN